MLPLGFLPLKTFSGSAALGRALILPNRATLSLTEGSNEIIFQGTDSLQLLNMVLLPKRINRSSDKVFLVILCHSLFIKSRLSMSFL